jgi:protease-4
LGLVDKFGGIEDAIQYAAKQAELGEDWEVEEYSQSQSLEERILKKLIGKVSAQKPENF